MLSAACSPAVYFQSTCTGGVICRSTNCPEQMYANAAVQLRLACGPQARLGRVQLQAQSLLLLLCLGTQGHRLLCSLLQLAAQRLLLGFKPCSCLLGEQRAGGLGCLQLGLRCCQLALSLCLLALGLVGLTLQSCSLRTERRTA